MDFNELARSVKGKTGVYGIRRKADGKIYVGSASSSIAVRWYCHRGALRKGSHHNQYLQSAWDGGGEGAFEFLVIEFCGPEKCLEREQFWLDHYGAADGTHGFNIAPLAGRHGFGVPRTDEHKATIGAAVRAAFAKDPTIQQRHAELLRGKKQLPEHIAKRTATRLEGLATGRTKHPGMSPDGRRRVNEANSRRMKGVKRSKEFGETISKAKLGKPVKHVTDKLTADDVREIRRRYSPGGRNNPNNSKGLAREFGVSSNHIMQIVRWEKWGHLDPQNKPTEPPGPAHYYAPKRRAKHAATMKRAWAKRKAETNVVGS